jgi:hypothetical protein
LSVGPQIPTALRGASLRVLFDVYAAVKRQVRNPSDEDRVSESGHRLDRCCIYVIRP